MTYNDDLLAAHVECSLDQAARNGEVDGGADGAEAQGAESSEQIRDLLLLA